MLRVLCAIPWTVWKGRHVVLCEEKNAASVRAQWLDLSPPYKVYTYTRNVPHFYPETDKSKSYCARTCVHIIYYVGFR